MFALMDQAQDGRRFHDERKEGCPVIERLVAAIDAKDKYVGAHSRRVAALVERMLWDLGIVGKEAAAIQAAARVHDIGKIYVPRYLLAKKGPLTQKEWNALTLHPEIGAAMLEDEPNCRALAPIVRYHHERWDGGGYPVGLSGTDIPLGSRIIAVADSYDAMTSQRPYCLTRSHESAVEELLIGAGLQWDRAAVASVLRVFARSYF
jgi:HD-GYP domain-containing protein (c-di-GMP phosphodiesterase class II)